MVEKADRRLYAHLTTGPVLDDAARLLLAWWTTAAEQGIDLAGYRGSEWAHSLAETARDMASQQVPKLAEDEVTPESAAILLEAVAERLNARGIRAKREGYCVPLPVNGDTPRWGRDGTAPLAITFTIDRGWTLVLDQSHGSRVFTIVGACNEDGIDAMLDLAVQINNGAFGNVFADR
jgi:hypothetical protein